VEKTDDAIMRRLIIQLCFVLQVGCKEFEGNHPKNVQNFKGKLVDSLVDKLFEQLLQTWPMSKAHVGQVTLGKLGSMALSLRSSLGPSLPHRTLSSFARDPCTRPFPREFHKVQRTPHILPLSAQQSDCEGDKPFNEINVVVSRKGFASTIRSQSVTDSFGALVPLDRAMGKGTSVVIFLRHLG
jgi:hypothetical protein